MINCMKVEVLDLADLYLTRREHTKIVRRMNNAGGVLAFAVGLIALGCIELDLRLQYLEQKLEKLEKKETAG